MSGEAYELPDAREPVLATVQEVSTSHDGSPLSHSQVNTDWTGPQVAHLNHATWDNEIDTLNLYPIC